MLINQDPPDHTKIRQIISRGFTPRSINAQHDVFVQRANNIVDEAIAKGSGDFVNDVGPSCRCRRSPISSRALEGRRAVVLVVDRPRADPVVAPVPASRPRRHGHQLDDVDPEVDQVLQPPLRGVEGALGGERPDVQLVDHPAEDALALLRPGPGRVPPGVPAGVEPAALAVHAVRLPRGPRVGGHVAAVEPEAIVETRVCRRARLRQRRAPASATSRRPWPPWASARPHRRRGTTRPPRRWAARGPDGELGSGQELGRLSRPDVSAVSRVHRRVKAAMPHEQGNRKGTQQAREATWPSARRATGRAGRAGPPSRPRAGRALAAPQPPSARSRSLRRVTTATTWTPAESPRATARACSLEVGTAAYVAWSPVNHSGWSRRSRSARRVTSSFSSSRSRGVLAGVEPGQPLAARRRSRPGAGCRGRRARGRPARCPGRRRGRRAGRAGAASARA